MRVLLSSRLTFAYKVILPALLGAFWSATTALLFTDPAQVQWGSGGSPPLWAKWLFLVGLVFAGGVFWRVCYPLKRIALQDGQLRISNFLREIVVPLDDIQRGGFERDTEIDESASVGLVLGITLTRRRPLAALELRHDTAFGHFIEFLPRSDNTMELLESKLGERFMRPEPTENKKTEDDEEFYGRGTV